MRREHGLRHGLAQKAARDVNRDDLALGHALTDDSRFRRITRIHFGSQQVASGQVREAETVDQAGALRAFAAAGPA